MSRLYHSIEKSSKVQGWSKSAAKQFKEDAYDLGKLGTLTIFLCISLFKKGTNIAIIIIIIIIQLWYTDNGTKTFDSMEFNKQKRIVQENVKNVQPFICYTLEAYSFEKFLNNLNLEIYYWRKCQIPKSFKRTIIRWV